MSAVGEGSEGVEVGGGGEIHKGRRGHDEWVRRASYVAQKLEDACCMLSSPGHNSTIRQDYTPNRNLIQGIEKELVPCEARRVAWGHITTRTPGGVGKEN